MSKTCGRNQKKIPTKITKNLYDLARSCHAFQSNQFLLLTKKRTKRILVQLKLSGKCKKYQEFFQEIQENLRTRGRSKRCQDCLLQPSLRHKNVNYKVLLHWVSEEVIILWRSNYPVKTTFLIPKQIAFEGETVFQVCCRN